MQRELDKEIEPPPAPERHRSVVIRLALGTGALLAIAGLAVLFTWLFGRPSVSLSSPPEGLVQIHLSGWANLSDVSATSGGRAIDLAPSSVGLAPAAPLAQGRTVQVTAQARPPSWLRWLLGNGVSATAQLKTPAAAPTAGVAVTSHPGRVAVHFDHPVSVVDYGPVGASLTALHLVNPTSVVDLAVPSHASEGTVQVADAPRSWEPVARPMTITWFVAPTTQQPVVLAQPVPGSTNEALTEAITLTFDEPVADVLGNTRPTISPAASGSWSQPDRDTLVFTPNAGFGYGPGTEVSVEFDRPVTILGTSNHTAFHFSVQPGSLLRLEQVLAQLRYLPLDFAPSPASEQPTTFAGEVASIDHPLAGNFTWRWASTPATLRSEWSLGTPNELVRGALMTFASTEANYQGYTADDETVAQLASASTWKALLEDAVSNRGDPSPYSYVYVSESLPQTLTLWENGAVVMSALTNTGIPARPTATGTYPIYVRYTFNYMSGFNPDGSYYHDPVYWINYFNGGDAVHGFPRGSYGYPQSLGCVELPISTAQVAFAHLAIGDLVTVAG